VREAPRFDHVSASESRLHLTDWLRTLMLEQQFETEMDLGPKTVPAAIAETARRHPGRVILQDVSLKELSYRRLRVGTELLASEWRRRLPVGGGRVGVLLPNVNAMPVVLLSLWVAGKVPAILNYSAGVGPLLACARLAGLKHLITARAFVEHLNLDLALFHTAGMEVILLEEARAQVSPGGKLAALLRSFVCAERPPSAGPEDTAVILFTSGSEGDPKGVELTHRNLLANIRQMLTVVDLMETDRFFNALPLFHCYGLNVGLFLPLVRGVFVFLYVSPLHYRVVPSAVYNLNCTVFFGTNTFLMGYGRKAHPYDFRTVRYVFAGAEKLQESTVTHWMRHFGVRILEGYGVTECSPCLSANLPMHPVSGSAGRLLPGIEYRLDPVEGIDREDASVPAGTSPLQTVDGLGHPKAAAPHTGRLLVRGPNIMRGYLNPEANARFQALGGWYDTGDIIKVDAEGYLFVLGRLKRFAKIGGEMVSLSAVEEALAGCFPQYGLRFAVAIVARPDEDRGEHLVAVTNEPRLTLAEVRTAVHARGLSNLAVPRTIKVIHDLPHLGSGKIDLRQLERMV
jgi:acyl-[acyl-carrier-protein]-phospholipid O-acyltransferase/long-chain-fatty-acid--[acyl-carrier-protein] ligase